MFSFLVSLYTCDQITRMTGTQRRSMGGSRKVGWWGREVQEEVCPLLPVEALLDQLLLMLRQGDHQTTALVTHRCRPSHPQQFEANPNHLNLSQCSTFIWKFSHSYTRESLL